MSTVSIQSESASFNADVRGGVLERYRESASAPLTSTQKGVDRAVTGFVDEASNWKTLAAMATGSFFYRVGRIGTMAMAAKAPLAAPVLEAVSYGVGLSAEVTAFQGVNDFLNPTGAKGQSYGARWRTSFLQFGLLKMGGSFAAGQNLIAQHAFQDLSMVAGHQVAAKLGWATAPEGSFGEQLLHAEITNLQLGAGMSLLHSFAPGLTALEKSLDLSLRAPSFHDYEGGIRFLKLLPSALRPATVTGEAEADSINAKTAGMGIKPLFMSPVDLGKGSETSSLREGFAQTEEAAAVEIIQARIADKRYYCSQLLRFSLDRILGQLQEGAVSPEDRTQIGDWLQEVKETQKLYNAELLELRNELAQQERDKKITREYFDTTQREAEAAYSRQLRATHQMIAVQARIGSVLNKAQLADIRRRLDWVLSLPEFTRDFSWEKDSLPHRMNPPMDIASDPYRMGIDLLLLYHPDLTAEDFEIFDRAVNGPIHGRNIAFDIDKTLGDTLAWHTAETELKNRPERYDGIDFDYFVHQAARMRIPYRGIQAMLIGLLVGGNTLRLCTAAKNGPNNLEVFLNDFPLMKIAFGLVSPHHPHHLLTTEDLSRSPYVMEENKRKEFYERYFNTPEGRQFVEKLKEQVGVRDFSFIKDGKMPFPDFPFEVLVDDLDYFAGEMQTLGLGRRWILASGSATAILEGLEQYFTKPFPETSPTMRRWLSGETNLLTLFAPADTLEAPEKGKVVTMEEAQMLRIKQRLTPLKEYFTSLGLKAPVVEEGLSPNASLRQRAVLVCTALQEQFFKDNYRFPDSHPQGKILLGLIRESDPLKAEIKKLLSENDDYAFLKVPLTPYFLKM
ncbi:MAG: hypothetical protein U1F57_04845 [bacterium]